MLAANEDSTKKEEARVLVTAGMLKEYHTLVTAPLLAKVVGVERCLEVVVKTLSDRIVSGEADVGCSLLQIATKLNALDDTLRSVQNASANSRQVQRLADAALKLESRIAAQEAQIVALSEHVALQASALAQAQAHVQKLTAYCGEYHVPSPFASLSECMVAVAHLPADLNQLEIRMGQLSRQCQELLTYQQNHHDAISSLGQQNKTTLEQKSTDVQDNEQHVELTSDVEESVKADQTSDVDDTR